MRFFDPTPEWIEAFKPYVGNRIVYDIGCGEGHVTRALRAAGVPTIGIELFPTPDLFQYQRTEEGVSAVLIGEAERYAHLLATDLALPLFCRPCHGGFFDYVYEATVDAAKHVPLPRREPWIYVGLDRNLDDDLEGFHRREIDVPRGPAGERTWFVTKDHKPFAPEWWYLVDVWHDGPRWARYVDSTGPRGKDVPTTGPGIWWIGYGAGLRKNGNPDLTIHDRACVADYRRLDLCRTARYQHFQAMQTADGPWYGWLDAEGHFTRCHYYEHDDCLDEYLNLSHDDAKALGLARVRFEANPTTFPGETPMYLWATPADIDRELTEKQAEALFKLNADYIARCR